MNEKVTTLTVVEDINQNLVRLAPEFQKALPPQISVDKFTRVAQTAITINPLLVQADRASLWSACMKCATDGLLPDGREAALVTFRLKSGIVSAQYMPMVGGILKKVRNSGELASITSQVVYMEDEFDYWLDEIGEHLKHKPVMDAERGEPRLAYAIARTKDGHIYIETMTEAQLQEVKKISRAKGGPWDGPFADEMRKKTVIRRLSKRLPMSTDLDVVVRRDDEMYDLEPAKKETDVPKTATPRLAGIVGAAPAAEVKPKEDLPPAPAAKAEVLKPSPAVEVVKPEPEKKDNTENIKKAFDATEVPEKNDKVTGIIKGAIDDFRSKSGKKANGAAFTRWAVFVEKKWLGTFSETHAKKLAEINANKAPVEIGYSVRITNNTKYFDIETVAALAVEGADQAADEAADREGESLI